MKKDTYELGDEVFFRTVGLDEFAMFFVTVSYLLEDVISSKNSDIAQFTDGNLLVFAQQGFRNIKQAMIDYAGDNERMLQGVERLERLLQGRVDDLRAANQTD